MGYLPYVPALVTGRQGNGETGVPEMVCGTGTTQNDRIMEYLPAFRDCKTGLQGRYYTERPNHGVPALCTCLSDGETGQRGDRGSGDGLRDRYYTKRRYCGVPTCFSGLQSRFAGQVLHRKAESWGTCLMYLP